MIPCRPLASSRETRSSVESSAHCRSSTISMIGRRTRVRTMAAAALIAIKRSRLGSFSAGGLVISGGIESAAASSGRSSVSRPVTARSLRSRASGSSPSATSQSRARSERNGCRLVVVW
jgi:hypothetical protein